LMFLFILNIHSTAHSHCIHTPLFASLLWDFVVRFFFFTRSMTWIILHLSFRCFVLWRSSSAWQRLIDWCFTLKMWRRTCRTLSKSKISSRTIWFFPLAQNFHFSFRFL
jgi:hypothetical protein